MILLRLTLLCIAMIGFVYLPALLGFAKAASPGQSTGSLVEGPDGRPVGSRLIAQKFTSDRYFHPRPSAADYNGQAAVGSNLSPTNPELAERAKVIAASYGATPENRIPADLVTASGSGLDPHITLEGAIYQIRRVAAARGVDPSAVEKVVDDVKRPFMGSFGGRDLLNVLELNLALDAATR